MEVGGKRHAPVALPPGKTGTRCIGGSVGLTAGLDGNSRPPPRFDPRPVQPVSSCYTYWAIPAHTQQNNSTFTSSRPHLRLLVLIEQYIYIYIYFFFLANSSPVGHGLLILDEVSRSNSTTHPLSVGLLWTRDQLVAETSTWQHTTFTDRHLCLRWDSNPRSQQPSGRSPTP